MVVAFIYMFIHFLKRDVIYIKNMHVFYIYEQSSPVKDLDHANNG